MLKMLKKLTSSIICGLILFTVTALADTGVIHNDGAQPYKAVRITPEIYNRSKSDLSDILIFDEKGNAVPYFINSFKSVETKEAVKTYPLAFLNSYVKSGDSYSDYFMETSEETDLLATSISVETQTRMFAKSIELRGSYDGIQWDFIQNDRLYRVDENEKLTLNFQIPLKYTHYRFKIIDNAEKIAFDNVKLSYNQVTVSQDFFTEKIIPTFATGEDGKYTVIKLFGLKNVGLKDLTIETDSQFKRSVSFAGNQSKTLYNLSFENGFYNDTTLPFNGYRSGDNELEIRINNGDDAPIEVKGITCSYYADEIIFKGQNGVPYSLYFGDSSVLKAPAYDIANYKELVLKEGYDILQIEDIKMEAVEAEPEKPDYSTAFNIVVVAVSLLLGFVILAKLKNSR